MTSQTRLCVFIFIAYGMIALTDAEDQIKCMNLHYSGPIKEVIEMKPTKLAEATSEAADIAKGFAIDLASNAIDGIPFVGAQLSSLFGHFIDAFDDDDFGAEDVYNLLSQEIGQLRKYMDQEIEELKFDQVKRKFGTERGGMLSYAQHCKDTYKSDPDDMANCLENLRSMLIQQYHFFVAEDSRPSSQEQTLPLFRMYGQLYVDTILDQIHVAKKNGKDSQAVAHAGALIKKVEEFKSYTEKAVKGIIKLQVTPHVMPTNNNPQCAGFCLCTIAIGPSKFDKVDKAGFPTGETKNYCVGIVYSGWSPCETTKDKYMREYMPEHGMAVATYWKRQLLDIVDKWGETAENLKPMVENHKRSLSLLERIKFESDVAAEIAKEKYMMQKGMADA